MIIAAIDTGKRGAVVVVNTQTNKAWKEKLTYDSNGLIINRFAEKLKFVDKIIIEKVNGRGGWGANTTFTMGSFFGQLMHEIIYLGKPWEWVLPHCWTAIVHRDVELIKGKNGAKAKTLRAYKMYFPHDPIGTTGIAGTKGHHDGVVDALMIATYELLKDNEPIPEWEFIQNLEEI